MKKHPLIFVFLSLSTLVFVSDCKKSDSCNAGSGGNVTLKLFPQHHGIPITSSSVYRDTARLKFNATDFPGLSNFDLTVAGNANENFVSVNGLKCGQYYIMMTGFDTSRVWNIRVVGGIPLNFSESSGEKDIVMPVTEQ